MHRRSILAGLATVAVGAALAAPAANAAPAAQPHEATTPGQKVSKSEGVIKNSAGEVIGGWKELPTDTPVALIDGVEYPGGGTWKYGTYVDDDGYKHCWSFYHHPTIKHSATADMSMYAQNGSPIYDHYVKVWANANVYAVAEPTPYDNQKTGRCSVYWGKWV